MAEGLSYEGADTRFEGYEQLELSGAKVTALYVDGTQVPQVQAGQTPSWCWTPRRSTPNRAARSVIPACWKPMACASPWPTR